MPYRSVPRACVLLQLFVPGGVIGAACRVINGYSEDWVRTPFYANEAVSQLISAGLFVGLCLYLWFGAMRHKENA